jgi:signal transduction histidine kinase
LRISNIHQKIGIIGLTILAIFVVLIPLFIINPINKLSNRMITFYKTNFNKDIEIEANHELEKLEEIFEKIVMEAKSGQKETM